MMHIIFCVMGILMHYFHKPVAMGIYMGGLALDANTLYKPFLNTCIAMVDKGVSLLRSKLAIKPSHGAQSQTVHF